jgi:hypothetical protein
LFFSLPNQSCTWHLRATPSATKLVLLVVDLLQTAVFSSGHANDAPSLSSPTHAVDVVFSNCTAAGSPRLLRICARLQLLWPLRDAPPPGQLGCCSSEPRETRRRRTTSGSHSHEAAASGSCFNQRRRLCLLNLGIERWSARFEIEPAQLGFFIYFPLYVHVYIRA